MDLPPRFSTYRRSTTEVASTAFPQKPFSSPSDPHSFVLGIRLLLKVESEASPTEKPTLVKKLMATLDSPARTSKSMGAESYVRYRAPRCTLHCCVNPSTCFLRFLGFCGRRASCTLRKSWMHLVGQIWCNLPKRPPPDLKALGCRPR